MALAVSRAPARRVAPHRYRLSAGGRQQVAINGRAYVGNTPTIVAKTGERRRWYVFNLDLGEQWHNFHPHGQRFRVGHEVMDARSLGPAESFVVDTIVPPVILVPECDHHSHYDDDDHDHTPGSSPPDGGSRLAASGYSCASIHPGASVDEIRVLLLHDGCAGADRDGRNPARRLLAGRGLRQYLGGPFGDRSGGLITFEAASRDDAERLVAQEPFLREGLLQGHWVKERDIERAVGLGQESSPL